MSKETYTNPVGSGGKERYTQSRQMLKKALAIKAPLDMEKAAIANLWGSNSSSLVRNQKISAMARAAGPRTVSILDVGCGTGQLAETLFGGWFTIPTLYLGIDLSPESVSYANQFTKKEIEKSVNRAALSFENCTSVQIVEKELRFDHVVTSGMFNIGWTIEEVMDELDRLWSIAGVSLIFNLLSTNADDGDADALYVNPSWMLDEVMNRYSKKVLLDHSYLRHDFTIQLLK